MKQFLNIGSLPYGDGRSSTFTSGLAKIFYITLKPWRTCSPFTSLEQVIPESSFKLSTDLQILHKTAFSTIHRAGFLWEALILRHNKKYFATIIGFSFKLSYHKHKKYFVIEETNMYHMGYLDNPAHRWSNGWFYHDHPASYWPLLTLCSFACAHWPITKHEPVYPYRSGWNKQLLCTFSKIIKV